VEMAGLTKSLEKEHTMTEPTKLVVRYAGGKILKGYTQSFYPNKPTFLLIPFSEMPDSQALQVHMKDLKALFFVRDFEGSPSYDERKHFLEDKSPIGRKVEVAFKDGEVLVGTTVGYDPLRTGFFLYPADGKSNNLRVFVVTTAVRKVRFL